MHAWGPTVPDLTVVKLFSLSLARTRRCGLPGSDHKRLSKNGLSCASHRPHRGWTVRMNPSRMDQAEAVVEFSDKLRGSCDESEPEFDRNTKHSAS